MLKTNKDRVVEFLLQCNPGPPKTRGTWGVDHHGVPFLLPSIGGITLNIQVGDPAFGWAGDHVEPGVSCTADTLKPFEHPNTSLQVFSCVGNAATVVTARCRRRFIASELKNTSTHVSPRTCSATLRPPHVSTPHERFTAPEPDRRTQ